MSSDKRDFSNFSEFPGDICRTKSRHGWYCFPPVESKDSMGRTRKWSITIRIITGKQPVRRKINWDLDTDTVIDIKKAFYKEVPTNVIAQIWTEQGIEAKGDSKYKVTRSIPTYITKGKNIGRSNETNVFTQALISARSKYLKRMQESSARTNTSRYFPVAVHKYDDKPRDTSRRIIYPAAVQRKLDGGRVVMHLERGAEQSSAIMYTRKLKDITGNPHIIDAGTAFLNEITKHYPGIYLDGEIYKHGKSLQEISGYMRRDAKSKTMPHEEKDKQASTDLVKLEYHIFDVFFPDKPGIILRERLIILDAIFNLARVAKVGSAYIVKVETYIADTKEEETELYKQFLKDKYEGSIVKNLAAPYEFGTAREIRTYQMRKRKPRYSAEYKVIGFTEGTQGKDKGAIIWILKTDANKRRGLESIEFTSTPVGMDYKDRYKMFASMTKEKFDTEFKDKMMTVEYDDISKDGVPLRAKAKGVRILD
jgi:ATP-dependent DNA ligase